MEGDKEQASWFARAIVWTLLVCVFAVIAASAAAGLRALGAPEFIAIAAGFGLWLLLSPLRRRLGGYLARRLGAFGTFLLLGFVYWTCGGNGKPPLQLEPGTPEHAEFEGCVQELYSPDEHSSPVARGIRRLKYKLTDPHDAEDVAHQTILNVCEETTKKEIDDLARYYGRSIENAYKDVNDRRGRHLECTVPQLYPQDSSAPWEPSRVAEVISCRLSPKDQELLNSLARGDSIAEIAVRQGVEPGTIRQRIHRAREALRDQLNALDPEILQPWY